MNEKKVNKVRYEKILNVLRFLSYEIQIVLGSSGKRCHFTEFNLKNEK